MKEFLGRKGNTVYLINLDNNEAVSFDSFGKCISKVSGKYALSVVSSIIDVDLLSIIGESCKNTCEIYFNGKVGVIEKGYLSAYSCIKDKLPTADYLVYSINHENNVSQIVVPLSKGLFFEKDIESVFGSITWLPLK